jgi:hypothetical protein
MNSQSVGEIWQSNREPWRQVQIVQVYVHKLRIMNRRTGRATRIKVESFLKNYVNTGERVKDFNER